MNQQTPRQPQSGPQRPAPDFSQGLDWLNTSAPLKLAHVAGKIILLNFWTSCSVKGHHVLAQLQTLQTDFPSELLLIGIHSPKYPAQQRSTHLLSTLLRYNITYPVLNDRDLVMCSRYGVRTWPTLVLIDPHNHVVGSTTGNDALPTLRQAIQQLIKKFDPLNRINRNPVSLHLKPPPKTNSTLAFPTGLHTHHHANLLFIADSGHHRILAAQPDTGHITCIFGDGQPGLRDGPAAHARFNNPQGLALDEDALYIADTANHAIRRLDLRSHSVETLAGTGALAQNYPAAGAAHKTPLRSPVDLTLVDDLLYIAMTGMNQIWVLDLHTEEIWPFAGSGNEGDANGPLQTADLAQPCGITADHRRLFLADTEANAIRSADLNPGGRTHTLVGAGPKNFGHRDGHGRHARLQHPRAITLYQNLLYVADTYNHTIKRVTPSNRDIDTCLGDASPGLIDGPAAQARFNEPAGLAAAHNTLYIADTNNHAIRTADLQSATVQTLQLHLP